MQKPAERVVALAELHAGTDYADPGRVEKSNRAADEIRTRIKSLVVERNVSEVEILLSSSVTASWAAYVVLESGDSLLVDEERCLSIVREVAAGDSLESMGAKAWLREHGYGT